ncbi:MAG TPA: hypothetical protein VFZ48_03005 [Candidatus Saccharimonadales bacterium]
MKENTKKATNSTKNTEKATKQTVFDTAVNDHTFNDFKNAALLVSVFINVFVFTAWITLQVTDRYNAQVVSLLLG